MSVGDGRGTRGRYLAWCSAAMSTVAIAGMGVSAAMAAEAAPAEDLPTEMVRLADGNSGYTCATTTTTTTNSEPEASTTAPTTTTTTAEPTTTTPDPTSTTAPAATTTTERCDPPKDHGKHDGKHEEHRRHVGGKHHGPVCTSATPQADPLHDLVGGLTGVGER